MNEQQLAAASAPSGYVQVIAGPGTGKTSTLVRRVVELLRRGLEPSRIVVVTFTRAAAREVLQRVREATESNTKIVIGTFHSVALRFLCRYGGETYRHLGLIDEVEKAAILRMDCDPSTDIRKVCRVISRIKAQCDDLALEDPALNEIYERYERRLSLLNKTDFDGLLLLFKNFLQSNNDARCAVDAVLVDEFQDTSLVQLEISMLLAERCGNMTVVGDPDQSIYGFRNADMRNFVRMADSSNAMKCYLEKNYRSEQAILTAATRVIANSQQRYAGDRQLVATRLAGNAGVQFVQHASPHEEAHGISRCISFLLDSGIKRSEICVLSRYTSKFESLESALVVGGIPCRMVGGKRLTEGKELRLIIDYMRVVVDGNDALAVERTVNTPRRGLGDKTLAHARNRDGLLTLDRVCNLAGEAVRSYTAIIKTARKLLVPIPLADVGAATEQAIHIVKRLVSRLFEQSSVDATQASSCVTTLEMILRQFAVVYEESDEDDDRTFLKAFLDQWTLGTDTIDTADGDKDDSGKVTLSTIHSAKGLEWPIVFMVDVSDVGASVDPITEDEERRLLYVAMTRAKGLLVVSNADASAGFDKLLHVPLSTVMNEITTPDMASLSACVGRELLQNSLASRKSVLSRSKRFGATAPVELPPGFQLASDLPQGVSDPPKRYPARNNSRISHASLHQESAKVRKKDSKQAGKTLLSFWGAAPK